MIGNSLSISNVSIRSKLGLDQEASADTAGQLPGPGTVICKRIPARGDPRSPSGARRDSLQWPLVVTEPLACHSRWGSLMVFTFSSTHSPCKFITTSGPPYYSKSNSELLSKAPVSRRPRVSVWKGGSSLSFHVCIQRIAASLSPRNYFLSPLKNRSPTESGHTMLSLILYLKFPHPYLPGDWNFQISISACTGPKSPELLCYGYDFKSLPTSYFPLLRTRLASNLASSGPRSSWILFCSPAFLSNLDNIFNCFKCFFTDSVKSHTFLLENHQH